MNVKRLVLLVLLLLLTPAFAAWPFPNTPPIIIEEGFRITDVNIDAIIVDFLNDNYLRLDATNDPVTGGLTLDKNLTLPNFAEGGVMFINGDFNVDVDAPNFFWSKNNLRLGIRTKSPADIVQLKVLNTNAGLTIEGISDTPSHDGMVTFLRARETGLTQVESGFEMGQIMWDGRNPTTRLTAAQYRTVASQDWFGVDNPVEVIYEKVQDGNTLMEIIYRIHGNGVFSIGDFNYSTLIGINDFGVGDNFEVLGTSRFAAFVDINAGLDVDTEGADINFDGGLTSVGSGVYAFADGDNDLGVASTLEVLEILEIAPTSSSTVGVIRMDGEVIIQRFPDSASGNFFLDGAGNFTLTGTENFGGGDGLSGLTTGIRNICFGLQCGDGITSGSGNIGFGRRALRRMSTGSNIVGIGNEACRGTSPWTGSNSICIGAGSGQAQTGGALNNVLIGRSAGSGITTGGGNAVISGFSGGQALTTGGFNTFVGYNVASNNTGQSGTVIRSVAIGFQSFTTDNDTIILGDPVSSLPTFGFGTHTPGAFVDINGLFDRIQFRVTGHSTQTNDLVLFQAQGDIEAFRVSGDGNTFVAGDLNVLGDMNVMGKFRATGDSNFLGNLNVIGDFTGGSPVKMPDGAILGRDDGSNFSTYDQNGYLTMDGGARVWKDIVIDVGQLHKPPTGLPEADEIGNFAVLKFDSDTNEAVFATFEAPYDWDTSENIQFIIDWAPTTADAGDVVWGCQLTSLDPNNGELLTDQTSDGFSTESTNSIQDELLRTSIFPLSSIPEVGDTVALRIFRGASAAADTYGADASLVKVRVRYLSHSLGQSIEAS
ncbi:hypothetical protein LCGC14_0464500 [marine sediment metagenome]|uniref:Uncharacterized protein n=1 Tax=marine sediment metagenome TaxID=412755 RepID=A0A0F9VMS4_9ZZZZ